MFRVFRKVKENITKEMGEFEEKRACEIKKTEKEQDSLFFLTQLKTLSEQVYPFKDPRQEYSGFRQYQSMDEIYFKTRENSITQRELIEITGLKSLRYVGGWDIDKWEASYREYISIYEGNNVLQAKSAKNALLAIHTNISMNKEEYSNFIFRYTETIANTLGIIKEYGVSFVFDDAELFNSIFSLIGSIVSEYDNYAKTIKEYKKSQALEKIKIEHEYIEKTIKENSLMLDFHQ